MKCASCGNLGMIHANGAGGDGPCKNWPRCERCGDARKEDASDTGGSWKNIRIELGLCDTCAIWEERARAHSVRPGKTLIINGSMYTPELVVPYGAPAPPGNQGWRGFGGQRFDFQRFDSGQPQTCYSLWHGGSVAEGVRGRMPDNARFITAQVAKATGES